MLHSEAHAWLHQSRVALCEQVSLWGRGRTPEQGSRDPPCEGDVSRASSQLCTVLWHAGARAGTPVANQLNDGPDYTVVSRNLALELVRVTEAGALAAGRWQGKGDKNAADQASPMPPLVCQDSAFLLQSTTATLRYSQGALRASPLS